jgi:glycosyltransferase involved in cell wall biosynthesis
MNNVKLLYLYNHKDWAVHNVGKLWLNGIPNIEVTFKEFSQLTDTDFSRFDLVWFGYLDLFLQHYCSFLLTNANLDKCLVSIHDPCELFPQQANWKRTPNLNLSKWWSLYSWYRWVRLTILHKVKYVIVVSRELQSILRVNGVKAFLIPTASSLPLRNEAELKTEKCDILSVFAVYPRKNISLIESIQRYCNDSLKVRFDTKVGEQILSTDGYTKLIDDHEVYVCTSYQEGGPIPAMDAMQRGSVVLSTPVGQLQELVKHGENGYICETEAEFIAAISLLAKNLPLLHRMRINSLECIQDDRNVEDMKALALSVIEEALLLGEGSTDNKERDVFGVIAWLLQRGVYRLGGGRLGTGVNARIKKFRTRR